MLNYKTLGCLALIIIGALCLLFAKFLVPIVPVLIGILAYYGTYKLRVTTFKKPQNIHELTEGPVLLEGTVVKDGADLTSPYFKENCIGYLYKEIEYVPNDDGYYNNVLKEELICSDFTLSTNSGSVKVIGHQLDLKRVIPKTHLVHSLKPDVNDIGYEEYLLKSEDKIVIAGTAVKNIYQRLDIAKFNNEPFFITSRNKIEQQKISHQVLRSLFPWMCVLYAVVNYFLFFAPSKNMPKNDVFVVFTFFGLPVLFLVFWLIGKDKKDWFSQVFQYLAGVCILSSLLSFPLLILFYMIKLDHYRIFCIFNSIVAVTALAMLFNYKKLIEYNTQSEKFTEKNSHNYDVAPTED